MLEIEIAWGDKNHPYELNDAEHTVGRSGDSDIKIPVARVSKSHAVLRVDGDRLFVRDRIVSAVDDFLAGEPNSDDVTLLLFRRRSV